MKRTPPPNPNWKPGEIVSVPFDGHESLDPETMDVSSVHRLMISSVVPRPIAFVSTVSKAGVVNLAPFSYFNAVASKPPSVLFVVAANPHPRPPHGESKDTLVNVRETGEFVVNISSSWFAEALNFTSAEFDYGVDEMARAGLTAQRSDIVKPPRVAESAIQMECKLSKLVPIGAGGPGSTTIVIGEIVRFHIANGFAENGVVSIEKLNPISRLGGISYGHVDQVFELPRPKA